MMILGIVLLSIKDSQYCPKSLDHYNCRETGITTYLKNGSTLEKVQQMVNHASFRTTKLYESTYDEISEKIII